MSRKKHWRLHCWEPKAACGRINGINYNGTAKPWIELSDSLDSVDCKACLNYIKKATS